MKYFVIATALLLGIVPAAFTQQGSKDSVQPNSGATITHVDASMAYGPGRVAIEGTHLGLVTEVRVGGEVVPVLHNDGRRIVIEPADQDPGFAALELVQLGGTTTGKIEFMPALSGHWRHNRIQVTLHPGEPGWYVLNYSYRRLRTPAVYQGIYFCEMLDMTTPYSGQLSGGILRSGDAVVFPWVPVPRGLETPGGLGVRMPMHIQAFCMLDDEFCYSNMLTLQPSL
jgi:hypothetical protein